LYSRFVRCVLATTPGLFFRFGCSGSGPYHRIGDHRIHKVVLCLLGVSGLTLIWPSIVGK
jgi:hypothetical protein